MYLLRSLSTTPLLWLIGLAMMISACSQLSENAGLIQTDSEDGVSKYDQYQIVTLLPRDAIQAIDEPKFISAAEAGESYEPQEMILGVEFNGDARAYSVPFLSSHEIVNDFVGGVPIAVTW